MQCLSFLTVNGVSFPATLEVLRPLDVFVATARHLHQRQHDVIQLAGDGQTKELLEGQYALRQVVALNLCQRRVGVVVRAGHEVESTEVVLQTCIRQLRTGLGSIVRRFTEKWTNVSHIGCITYSFYTSYGQVMSLYF